MAVNHYCTNPWYGIIALLHLPDWLLEEPSYVRDVISFGITFRKYQVFLSFRVAKIATTLRAVGRSLE